MNMLVQNNSVEKDGIVVVTETEFIRNWSEAVCSQDRMDTTTTTMGTWRMTAGWKGRGENTEQVDKD